MKKLYEFILSRKVTDLLYEPFRFVANYPKTIGQIFIILSTGYIIICKSLYLLSTVISTPGVVIVLIGVVVLISRFVGRVISYPGSLPSLRKEIEGEYGRYTLKRIQMATQEIKKLMYYIETNKSFSRVNINGALKDLQIIHIPVLKFYINTFKILKSNNAFSNDAKKCSDCLTDVVLKFDELQPVLASLLAASASHDELKEKCKTVVKSISDLAMVLPLLIEPEKVQATSVPPEGSDLPNDIGIIPQLLDLRQQWGPTKAVGTLDMLRAEIMQKFGGISEWVVSTDGKRIDTMYFLAANVDKNNNIPVTTDKLVILSSPNAGIYEFHHWQNDLVTFYVENGVSVVIWNYRGYGRSEGSPWPQYNRMDAECIYKHYKSKFSVQKMALHGESIGGCVSTYCAHKLNADFLMADRAFCDLPSTGALLMGKWAGTALRMITNWAVETNNIDFYLSAECYKVHACDPKDEIVRNLSSLKVGVARKLELGEKGNISNLINSMDEQKLTPEKIKTFFDALTVLVTAALSTVSSSVINVDELSAKTVEFVKIVCSLSSGCGDTLLHAFEEEKNKLDSLTAFLCSLLVWGPSSCQEEGLSSNIVLIVDLKDKLDIFLTNCSSSVRENVNIKCVTEMVSFLAKRWEFSRKQLHTESIKQYDSNFPFKFPTNAPANIGFGKVGFLVPLHTGHNANLTPFEKQILKSHLKLAKFIQ